MLLLDIIRVTIFFRGGIHSMAVPYGKTSKSKKRKRNSHTRVVLQKPGTCPRCNSPVLSHTICPVCGFYRGKQVMVIKTKEKKKPEEKEEKKEDK
ncbi:MAG: 50S ribosomal protein L32 [Candidatus Hydrogenedentota bacterium]